MEELNDQWIVAEPGQEYDGAKYPLQKETYRIIGICMEVHRLLGPGFKEAIYKDALQNEFLAQNISFEREKKYSVTYKGKVLPHAHYADFVIDDKIIFEVKAVPHMPEVFFRQVVNYLAASKLQIGLLINFGGSSLMYRRIILGENPRNN